MEGSHGRRIWQTNDKGRIIKILGFVLNGTPSRELDEESEANAQLIAAAPEMFAALVALLPHAARAIQGTTEGQPLLDAARAAIAKATQEPTA
jgi:hypothetical protein